MKIVAKTLAGLEEILAKEIAEIGGKDIEILNRAVRYSGDKSIMYESNYALRTALRILLPVFTFDFRTQEEYYNKLYKHDWFQYSNERTTLAVDASLHSQIFTHSKYVALKTKDAVVDFFRKKTGKRPDVDIKNPGFRVNVHIYNSQATISLDSSNISLHKRGYKLANGEAPLSEVLAAGLVLLSGWDKKKKLVDPMCGSGTIAMEAFLIASNTAPQFRKSNFGFQKWKDYDDSLFRDIKTKYKNLIDYKNIDISGFDLSEEALENCQQNINGSPVFDKINFSKKNFFHLEGEENTHLIMNPPYDLRLKSRDIDEFYSDIGDTLKTNWQNCEAWIFSGNLQAIKNVGLRPSKKISLYNGPLPSKFHKYELYGGSRKNK
jgi:putative N6-adenine-specific DNA methylase